MYEERDREAELSRQDDLDGLEEEHDIARARSAFYQQPASDTKAEKCGRRHIILVISSCVSQRRKRISSNHDGRDPSSSMNFSQEDPIAFVMHRIIALSRIPGTLLGSDDSMNSCDASFLFF